MNARIVRAIVRKDLREVLGNKAVWAPALFVPLILVVVLPVVYLVIPSMVPPSQTNTMSPETLARMMRAVPPAMAPLVRALPPVKAMGVLMSGFLMAPMFLIVPLMLSSIIGANAFVGEKERKTLEALLYTPATDLELLVGKTLTALIPAIFIAWVSFAVYAMIVNGITWSWLGYPWFPPAAWWPLMIWVTPAIAAMGLLLAVIISARVSTFMEANQMAGLPVLLVVGLMAGQVSGVMFFGVWMTLALGTVFWLLDAVLLMVAVRTFARTEMISRL